jgi:hypothetical protein
MDREAPASKKRAFAPHPVSCTSVTCRTIKEPSPNLDTLPNELLQKIFWESLELSMIFVSKKIAARLPRFGDTARNLVLLAFHSRYYVDRPWNLDHYPACSHLGLDYPLSIDDRKGLQERVLDSGWLTIHMLTLAMGEMQEGLVQKQWLYAEIVTLPASRKAIWKWWANNNKSVLDRTLELSGVDELGRPRSLVMTDPFYITLNDSDDCDRYPSELLSTPEIDFVPDKLLDLPIRASKLRFLHFIWRTQSGRQKRWTSHSEPAMRQAVQHAISTGKLGLTCLLIELRRRGTPSPARAEDFLTAARNNHVHVLQFLIEFDSRELPYTDSHFTQWVRSVEDRGDSLGGILLAYMQAGVDKLSQYSFADFQYAERRSKSRYRPQLHRTQRIVNRLGEGYGIPSGRRHVGVWRSTCHCSS